MRILMVSDRFLPDLGGVQIFTARLAEALIERGHEIAVLTTHPGLGECEEDRWRGVTVYRLPFDSALRQRDYPRVISLRRDIVDLKRAIRPDVVHLNTASACLVFHLLTPRAIAAATVVTLHWLPDAGGIDTRHCRRVRAAADWVVAVTRCGRRAALEIEPAIAPRTSIIYNSLPTPWLPPASLDFAALRLLCLGRLETEKGFDVALRALAAVRERLPAARMTIAGDGGQRPALERLAVQLDLETAVRFTGWVAPDDVPALINAHTVVLMPSRFESFGLVALQAAQMGRPVIGSCIPGLSEVVRDGETGLLCPKDDAAAFAAAIASLVEQPVEAARMGRRARAHAQSAFPWDEHVTAYETLFGRVAHP